VIREITRKSVSEAGAAHYSPVASSIGDPSQTLAQARQFFVPRAVVSTWGGWQRLQESDRRSSTGQAVSASGCGAVAECASHTMDYRPKRHGASASRLVVGQIVPTDSESPWRR
jgi:hypothetical protein